MVKERYEVEGKTWFRISYAARLLGTNAQGIRKLMGDGTLDWRQPWANSRTFVVDGAAVMALMKTATRRVQRSPDPLARFKKPDPSVPMEGGTMNRLRTRLRNQMEVIPSAPNGGAPGRRSR